MADPTADGATPERRIVVDPDAIRSNVERLRELVAPAQTMVVVKADGYGHGAITAARAATDAGTDWLGTADVREALALRDAGIRTPILAWLHGARPDFRAAAAAGVDVGVSSAVQLGAAAEAGATVQLKVDTGLSRNGIPLDALPELAEAAADDERAGRLRIRGVFSHLANASDADSLVQLARFEAALDVLRAAGVDPGIRHLAASESALTLPETRLDLVRLGISAYGLAPDPRIDTVALGLHPAMEVSAPIVSVKRIAAGEGVSYGFDFRTERATTVVLVPLGYADGIPRAASGRAQVAIDGERFPVVGRIAMDQLVVDVGDARVRVGDRAVLWGDPASGAPSAADWAAWAGTICYEIVTRVGGRCDRATGAIGS